MKRSDMKNETLVMLALDALVDKLNSFKTTEEAVSYMKKQLARPREQRWEEYHKELTAIKKRAQRAS